MGATNNKRSALMNTELSDFEFTCTIEGIDVDINSTNHAIKRLKQRKISTYAVCGTIIAVGEDILDFKHGEEFVIMDNDLNISIICSVYTENTGIAIDIITVIDTSNCYNKRGMKIIRYPKTFEEEN